jgi:hypothetical protein
MANGFVADKDARAVEAGTDLFAHERTLRYSPADGAVLATLARLLSRERPVDQVGGRITSGRSLVGALPLSPQ